MTDKILFVVNPISGGKDKTEVIKFIENEANTHPEIELAIWQHRNDWLDIQELIKNNSYQKVISVGGDGTINLLGKTLINTQTPLGIIPFGSGNGLARVLNIPLDFKSAYHTAMNGKTITIDAATINHNPFFCTAGLGIDARIGQQFALSSKRGFISYATLTLREFFSYKPEMFSFSYNGVEKDAECYLLTVANTNQFGNNAYIAPNASLTDGLLDVCIISPFPFTVLPSLVYNMFTKKLSNGKYYQTFKTDSITIKRSKSGAAHYDGEPAYLPDELTIKSIPKALKVIVG